MPYIHEPMPIVSTPPMREWYMLQLPWSGEVSEIKHVNMRNLQELYCDYSQLTTLPWDELKNLYYLGIYGCYFTSLELWQMPNLYSCYADENYGLVWVDAHDLANLGDLNLYYCQSLTDLDVSGCSNLRYIYAYGCAFDEAMVDQLLADLVANGTTNGYLQMNGPYNSPPSSPDGVALKNILISRGWSVYTS
ncbi:MAG: hypothetical protein GX616_13735 [Planctomycetes bacterium]|nr:hypothetical protein [Planctomycetota bacterium]